MAIRSKLRLRPWLLAALVYGFATGTVSAGMREILEAVQMSEFRFARQSSEVPFMPLGWTTNHYYPQAEFEADLDGLPDFCAEENTTSLGAVVPVYVQKRDMLLVGMDIGMDLIWVESRNVRDQAVVRLTPVAAWLHQAGPNNLVGTFVAPIFSKETRNGGDWGIRGYAGLMGMHWVSDTLQLIYGGVYENNYGHDAFYPYLGVQWTAHPKVALSLIFPWPAITYAPTEDWILQLGITPGGSSWVKRRGTYEVKESFGSWNFSAGAGYRLHGNFWLFGSAGVAGFRSWKLGADDALSYDAKPSAVFTIALQFRP